MSNKQTQSAFPITGLLLVIFITLKALKLIDWSWLWVFSPLWISVGILVIIVFFALIYKAIKEL